MKAAKWGGIFRGRLRKMRGVGHMFGGRRMQLLRTAGLVVVAVPVVFGLVKATQSRAQSQGQDNAARRAPVYEYEVGSIKPNKSGSMMPGGTYSDDGINLTNTPLMFLLVTAFGVGNDRISGAPGWLASERYDIEAKADSSVAEALQKLGVHDRKLAQQLMIQALLTDRCKLKFHRETKELPIYALVIGKNGPKFQESKPDETSPYGFKVPDGRGGTGSVQVGERGALIFRGLPISFLVNVLSGQVGRTVVDKTGLAGKYDFTWEVTPDMSQFQAPTGIGPPPAGGVPNGVTPPTPPGPGGASLFTRIEEQLGLKLESGKGSLEIIVIDHFERPSDN
jgi:uncharacterized protein (TIGR03435 family)